MSLVANPNGQKPVFNGPSPYPTLPGSKRPLEGPDAHHVPVPHPSQRQRPPDSYWPPNDPSQQNQTIHTGVPFYMVGQQQQQQRNQQPQQQPHQIQHDFSLGAVGQAAPPPLEAEIMGLSDPATAARKRAEMVAKLDRLSPDTIKALLLEASLRHFTVADQVGLEHEKISALGPQAMAPVAPNPYPNTTYTWTYPPVNIPYFAPAPPPPPPPPPPRKPPVIFDFDRYHDASLRELTRYDRLKCSKQYEAAFDVHDALGRMFSKIAAQVEEDDDFSTKSSALLAMLTIWDNCLDTEGEIGRKVRNECDEWVSDMRSVFDTLYSEDLCDLASEPALEGSNATWLDYAERTRRNAAGYNPPLADALQEVIDAVRAEYDSGEVVEDEEEEEEETAEELPSAPAAQPASASEGGTRAQPVVLD